jgi:hypothetical protein
MRLPTLILSYPTLKGEQVMRKLSVLLMVLALAFLITVPALADYTCPVPGGLDNEVTNGTFDSVKPGNVPEDWNQKIILGVQTIFDVNPTGQYAQSTGTTVKSKMYQIIDESKFNGWLDNGNSKNWWFKFDYQSPDDAVAVAAAFYYDGISTSPPGFGDIDNPGNGWEPLLAETTLNETSCGFEPICVNGTIIGFQPQWIAIAFEGLSSQSCDARAAFDNIEFYGQCESFNIIPVPPSVVLLGSGLLSLAIFRFTRANRH